MHNTVFVSHGGGPLPLLGDKSHQSLVENLKALAHSMPRPQAIVAISAHWEEEVFTVTSGPEPGLIYDYYGFPEASYNITYPCLGVPSLAANIHSALQTAGLPVKLDASRGFDHGVFVPLKIMYPDATIPCVQISLCRDLNPEKHIELGKVLSQLDSPNLLILGSGYTFHNMSAFFEPNSVEVSEKNTTFETWLSDILTNPTYTQAERERRIINWQSAPHAAFCHPREEHLLPLHVCIGAAKGVIARHFDFDVLNIKASSYQWDRETY